jgi:hypothetical protein
VTVWLVDTSILCEILEVPGKVSQHEVVYEEFTKRALEKHSFVIPVTTIIETGNHIANAKTGDRRAAAIRFHKLLTDVQNKAIPFRLEAVTWNADFLQRLLDGDSTNELLVDLIGNGRFGAGDISILVERDLLRSRSSLPDVRIWTADAELQAYA